MRRFIEMSFDILPKEDGRYIVVRENGEINTVDFTTEFGWNTDERSHQYAMEPEKLAASYKCWLKPFHLDSARWATVLSDLILDVEAEIDWYEAIKEGDEDLEEVFDTLIDLKHYLREAEEITEAFK